MNSFVKCFLFTPLLVAVSCAGPSSEPSDTGNRYLDSLLSNPSSREYGIVSGIRPGANRDAVALFGDPDFARAICVNMVEGDSRDNVDGRVLSDGLPDFAGETFYAILDEAAAPYVSDESVPDVPALRSAAVRGVVSALDTVFFKSYFEPEGSLRKLSAKLIVIASPALELYGKDDISHMFEVCGSSVPVVYPVHSCFEALLKKDGRDQTVGVLAPAGLSEAGIYESIFRKVAGESGRYSSDVIVSGAGASIAAFLDDYSSRGYSAPVGALLVDCGPVDMRAYSEELEKIKRGETADDYRHGKLLATNFRIIDTRIQTSSECYSILRRRNAFAHFISAPAMKYYYTESEHEGEFKVLEYK